MQIIKIISSEVDSFNRRVIKFLRFGKRDIQTSFDCAPCGIDANPIKDMVAIYSETTEKGKTVIIGYIKRQQLTAPGELRLYSTDAAGTLKFYTWLRANGTLELGGSTKHLTRFEELESGFNQLRSDFNSFLTHVHGGSGTPPAPPAVPSTASIATAKINEIKTL